METVFSVSNLAVLPFWFLMLALPHWRWTRRLLATPLVAVAPALIYAALVLPHLSTILPVVLSPSLVEIAALLGTPAGATIAWVHFLTFDLLVGRWAYLDSRQRGLSAWLMAPLLFTILMLGPLGFLLYLATRALMSRRSPVTANPTASLAV